MENIEGQDKPEGQERLDTIKSPHDFKDYKDFQEYCKDVARQDLKEHYPDKYGDDIQDALKPDTLLSRGFN